MKSGLFKTFDLEYHPQRKEADLRFVPLSFGALILVGALLLALPWSHQVGKSVSLLDGLFVSVSATCVTGLVTVNVAETFNTFGQGVILALIQLGGIGILTASTLLVLLTGNRLSLMDEQTIHATMGRLRRARPVDILAYGIIAVVMFELAGTLILFVQMTNHTSGISVGRNLWEAAFHSVSAFCNAGISIYPEGLARWRKYPDMLATIDALVIAGGIGLLVLVNLRYYYFWRRDPRRRGYLSLQTRISVLMVVVLVIVGAATTMFFEWNHTLKGTSLGQKLSWSVFHSTMSRTAGFNVADLDAMDPPTLLFTQVLMFVGGSPGSMAGGIKTVTVFLLVAAAWSGLRRREEVTVFKRRISPKLSYIAVMLLLLGMACVMVGVGLLMITEQDSAAAASRHHWLALMFEAVSAFGTVGLSTGVTPLLTAAGKCVIIALMFTGRVGPLILTLYLARPPSPWHLRYPSEDLSLG